MRYELYALGFNGHGQLTGQTVEECPEDLSSPRCIFEGGQIRMLFVGWSDCLFEVDGQLILRGASAIGKETILKPPACPKEDLRWHSAFGDHTGLKGLVTEDDEVCLLHSSSDSEPELQLFHRKFHDVCIAGNGRVCATINASGGSQVLEYSDFASFEQDLTPAFKHTLPCQPLRLCANEVSFSASLPFSTALPSSVYTWGDPRYSSLGRTPSEDAPASIPCPVENLGGTELKELCSGGWVTAALAQSGDVYIWGGRPGDPDWITSLPRPGSADVELLDFENAVGENIEMVGVGGGAGHLLLLAQDGSILIAGKNYNGQLGIDPSKRRFVDDFQQASIPFERRKTVESVHCGGWSSFILVVATDH